RQGAPTASRVMREKLKCGTILASTRSSTFFVLPAWISLSARNTAITSSVTRLASASGAVSCACAGHVASIGTANSVMANIRFINLVIALPFVSLPRLLFAGAAALGRFAIHELADQFLEHHCRLRELYGVSVREYCVVGAAFEADVLLAKQPGGQDGRRAVLRKLEMLFDVHGHLGHEFVVIEGNVGNAADDHPGAFYRRARLEPPDIGKRRRQLIGLGAAKTAHVADLEREYGQRQESRDNEQADPQVECRAFH